MNNAKHETIADIVSAMRKDIAEGTVGMWSDFGGEIARSYADRIEAAATREREATREKSSQVGNGSAMREALERCASMGEQIDNQLGSSEDTVYAFRGERCLAHNISECARAALSAPPRNCDVGTADEQYARFDRFCDKIEECKECPLWRGGGLTSKCCTHWAQLPYEEGGAK